MDYSTFFDPKEALITDIILISPQATVAEALRQLSGETTCRSEPPIPGDPKQHVSKLYAGCVLASADGRLIDGILTERDFVRLVIEDIDLNHLTVAEVMITSVISLQLDEFNDVFAANNIFHRRKIRHLPVLNRDGSVAGIVTNASLQNSLKHGHFLKLRTISEVMTGDVVTVPSSARISECAALMIGQRISCVVVTDESSLDGALIPVGILTERDLLQLKNLQVDFGSTSVDQVMSTPLTFVHPNESMAVAQELMKRLRVHRLVVTTSEGILAGIVTSTSLSRAIDPQHLCSIMEILQMKLDRLSAAHYMLLTQHQFDLESAFSRNEFRMVYQPIVDLSSGKVCSAEALMRWTSPIHGHVAPDQFIPLAEGNGFIRELGYWSIEECCQKFSQADRGILPVRLSVNVSGIQLSDPDFIRNILVILDRASFDPTRLQIELTEAMLVDETVGVNDIFNELRSYGISVAIDDFGTGFSSFSYLQRFSFDVLKLDRSLIGTLGTSDRAQLVVGTMQHLAERLEFRIVAEGVETAQELNILREIGCDAGQGYLFSRPLEFSALEDFDFADPSLFPVLSSSYSI
jgi:EAL domain-containing protein (putative c-di-GMP-specific phosphodiesterase class I)/CBS domain-containing protein